ncbi:CLUMA_CG014183, isoform A [Clunio marinus]|uniref:CLUMA_CG014183, isoform A n=1 Tax=Clunio marinus TaxID=568069 RepID=A0A1J1IL98_9DIPT|nr:CLUMA_CG014183, isoform A [Clunio marinus]
MEFARLWFIFVLQNFFVLDIFSYRIRRYSYDLFENDYCGLDVSVYHGKCKKISQCVNVLVEKRAVEICSFNGITPQDTLVCCSREDFYKSISANQKGPLDYDTCIDKYKHLRNIKTFDFTGFVVGGVEVNPGEFVHMAAIGWLKWSDFSVEWNCGGSLITETFVLTAAHCTLHFGRAPNVVRLGDNDLNSVLDDTYVQQFGIVRMVRHPSYDFTANNDDIALIQIHGQVIPTQQIIPGCIIGGIPTTDYFEAAGYGQNGSFIHTNKLAKVQLKNIPMDECKQSYDSIDLSEDTQLCAKGYRDDIEAQDTCYGDSGSPLQYINEMIIDDQTYEIPTIVGITSFGIGCAFGHPSVYVKVSNYISWMESVINS